MPLRSKSLNLACCFCWAFSVFSVVAARPPLAWAAENYTFSTSEADGFRGKEVADGHSRYLSGNRANPRSSPGVDQADAGRWRERILGRGPRFLAGGYPDSEQVQGIDRPGRVGRDALQVLRPVPYRSRALVRRERRGNSRSQLDGRADHDGQHLYQRPADRLRAVPQGDAGYRPVCQRSLTVPGRLGRHGNEPFAS